MKAAAYKGRFPAFPPPSIVSATAPRAAQLRTRLAGRAAVGLGLLATLSALCALLAGSALAPLRTLHTLSALPHLLAAGMLTSVALRLLYWLWVPPPGGAGILLPESRVPGLRRRVDRLCAQLGARRIDRIVVTPDMNAGVICRPALGLIGPMRTTLLLGIPLAHSLTARQLSAVLAHELAHLSAQLDGPGAWSAHLRTWWLRCADRIDADRSVLARAVMGLYAPVARLDLEQSVALSRLDEFEADAVAARAVGSPALAGALIELAMKDRFLHDDYWVRVLDQADDRRRPRVRPFREMGLGVQVGFVRRDALAGLDHLLRSDAGSLDTHPSLPERLDALRIGRLGGLPVAGEGPSAAEHYFASLLPTLSLAFDRMWWRASADGWRQRYRQARGQDQT